MSYLDLVVGGTLWVALLYYGLAFVTVAGFYLRGVSRRQNNIARVGALAFYIGCGLNHVDMAKHSGLSIFNPDSIATPMDYTTPHHALPVFMQAIGAFVFLTMVLKNGTRGFYFAFGKEQRARAAQESNTRASDTRIIERLEAAGALNVDADAAQLIVRSTRDS